MAGDCCGANSAMGDGISPRYRKALWAMLWINVANVRGGDRRRAAIGSVSLLADAADFPGDTAEGRFRTSQFNSRLSVALGFCVTRTRHAFGWVSCSH